MKIARFNYEKKDNSISKREIMVMHSAEGYVDGIDLSKLSVDEIVEMTEIQLAYEKAIEPFNKTGFRKFSTEGVTELTEEIVRK